MTLSLQDTELYEQLSNPNNPASIYINDDRLLRDIWNVERDLPSLASDARITKRKHLYFDKFSLEWLKSLTKLAVLVAIGSRQWSLGRARAVLTSASNFDAWLVERGYLTPSLLVAQTVYKWGEDKTTGQKSGLAGLLKVLRELNCIQIHVQWQWRDPLKRPKTIPEDVKHQLDNAFEQLDKPVYLVFKLLEALGCRSIEIPKIPLDCLRRREGFVVIRFCTGKQDDRKREQDLPQELTSLVQQQQAYVREEFGQEFPWLIPNWICHRGRVQNDTWPPKFLYEGKQLETPNLKLNALLKRLVKQKNVLTHDGSLAYVTTHMFRHTYATVADHMGKRPDQIQHGLGHANLDMQDSYINVSPKQQEKRIERVLVDKDGRRTIYQTDLDSELVRKEWKIRQVEVGICTRPNIIDKCEFEHVCLGCQYVRFSKVHLPRLLEIRDANQHLLEHCQETGQMDSRRANSTRQIIDILTPIIDSLHVTNT